MGVCAVYGCASHSRHARRDRIKFFRFPTEKFLAKKWQVLCRRSDNFNVRLARICSLHFKKEEYSQKYLQKKINLKISPNKIRCLAPGALPSLHLPVASYSTTTSAKDNMTPARKSGRQPKLTAKFKEFLSDGDVEKGKAPAPAAADKNKTTKVIKKPNEKPISKVKSSPLIGKSKPAPASVKAKLASIKSKSSPSVTKPKSSPSVAKPKSSPSVAKPKPSPANAKPKSSPAVTKVKSSPPKKVRETQSTQIEIKRKCFVQLTPIEPVVRAKEIKRLSQVTKESPDDFTPSRKSGRTPKPSVKLEDYVYDDDREKSVDSETSSKASKKTTPKVIGKTKKIKLEPTSDDDSDSNLDMDMDLDSGSDSDLDSDSSEPPAKKLFKNESGTKKSIQSPRQRVTNLTSISAKKEKGAQDARLTMRKGKIYTSSSVHVTPKGLMKSVADKRGVVKKPGPVPKSKTPTTIKRKREPEKVIKSNKNIKTTKAPQKTQGKMNKTVNQKKNVKPKVEKKEIEKVLQVNKEVMTQLLNFGAEVAEAMACNNESIFSFSKKDNPLQTFKIDKQDDFTDEEVVKIIKWFEEEEDQRRAYRKRILEALRSSHETNMSLYTQMLKMLQSVTTC